MISGIASIGDEGDLENDLASSLQDRGSRSGVLQRSGTLPSLELLVSPLPVPPNFGDAVVLSEILAKE